MSSRRTFLTAVGMAGGALGFSGISWRALARSGASTGERYGDFVLLNGDEPAPSDVLAAREAPFLCSTGEGRGGAVPNGRTLELADARAAAAQARLPLYAPGQSRALRPSGARVVEYDDGDVYAAVLSYDSADVRTRQVATNVVVSAYRHFPRPVPLWGHPPLEPGGPAIVLEKADFLPRPGVMIRHADGFVFHWVSSDVYYVMAVENGWTLAQARELVARLEWVIP